MTPGCRCRCELVLTVATAHEHTTGPLFALLAVDHCDALNSCSEDEPMLAGDECLDAATDESLLETNPIQSPLQVFAGMGGLALIAERLPMLYPDVIQQVRRHGLSFDCFFTRHEQLKTSKIAEIEHVESQSLSRLFLWWS